ncbi:hypothetical protein ACHAXS_006809 [Conticribra weissflogii]
MRSKSKSSLCLLSKKVNIDHLTSLGVCRCVQKGSWSTQVTSPVIICCPSKFPLSSLPKSQQPPRRIVRLNQWNNDPPRRQLLNYSLGTSKGHSGFRSFSKLASVRSDEKLDSDPTRTQNDTKNGKRSLNSEAHYILNLRLGSISKDNIEKAKKIVSIVSKWENVYGAELAEALLERLHKEQTFGKNRNAAVNAKLYESCMEAWRESGVDEERIVSQVAGLRKRMEERLGTLSVSTYAHTDNHSDENLIDSNSSSWADGVDSECEFQDSRCNYGNGDGKRSLHSDAHFLIHKIPIGSMNNESIQNARSMLSSISKWNNENGATMAEAILERLHREYIKGKNPNASVDSEMYNICINAWTKSETNGKNIIAKAESLVNRMEIRYARGRENSIPGTRLARPDRITYNSLINAYSLSEEDSSERVDAILEKMNALADSAANSESDRDYEAHIRPDEISYNSVLNYYASRKNQHWSAQRAEDLLLKMSEISQQQQKQYHRGDPQPVMMSTTTLNIVLNAWSNSGGGIRAAQRAEALLHMMIRLFNKGHENIQPNAVSFSIVINAYSQVNSTDTSSAVEKATELLDLMEGFPLPSNEGINSCYNAVANVFAKSGLQNAGDKVQELMARIRNMDTHPDPFMIASCIEAFISAADENSRQRGKDLLLRMIDDPSLQPNSVAFNTVINAIVRDQSKNRFDEAEELISIMENIGGDARPDLATYSIIMGALSKREEAVSAEKAVQYLRMMLRSYNNDGYVKAKPNSFIFNSVINMVSRCKCEWADDVIYKTLVAMETQKKQGNELVIPDTITYNTVIGKLSKSPSKKNAKKVMRILGSMEDEAKCGRTSCAPDIITYTSVLNMQRILDPRRAANIASSYIKRVMSSCEHPVIDRDGFRAVMLALTHPGNFEHAETAKQAYEWMENNACLEAVDSRVCDLVLVAFKNSNNQLSAEGVNSFLTDRVDRYLSGQSTTILPTIVGFSAGLSVLGKYNRMGEVVSFLGKMIDLSNAGIPEVKPDEGCYVSILASLASHHQGDTAFHAQRILEMSKQSASSLSSAPFNAAINACASTSGDNSNKRKALEISFNIFEQAKELGSVDSLSYGMMIRACMRLVNDDDIRYKLVKSIFHLCAKNGLVDDFVLKEMGNLSQKIAGNKA